MFGTLTSLILGTPSQRAQRARLADYRYRFGKHSRAYQRALQNWYQLER